MAAGNQEEKHSALIQALAEAETGTTGEIRVHLSKRWIEKNPFKRVVHLFHRFGMGKTTHKNAVLLYVNLRRKKFAVIGDEGIHKAVGQSYWEGLVKELQKDLSTTHTEKAIALAVLTIGATLKRYFPVDTTGSQGTHVEEAEKELTED